MLSINTNLSSLIAQNSMSSATKLLNQAVERMTTGYKINHSKDNAANYSISTNLTTKINAYMVAEDNCAMGLDMLSTANGSLDQISDKLTRLRDLQTQASNGTYGATSLNAINAEANALVDEISRLYQTAEYKGKKLFSSSDAGATPAVAAYGARAAGTGAVFMKEVAQRDTSSMTKLESVSETATISNGTYSISTVEELEKLVTMTNNGKITGGEFVLANDIDMGSITEWTPIGFEFDVANFSPAEDVYFTGTFDGNGYAIKNFHAEEIIITNGDGTALIYSNSIFGHLNNTTIKNLNIENYSSNISASAEQNCISTLAMTATNSTIYNCSVSGSIVVTNDGMTVGSSLLNAGNATTIDSCYSNADVNCYAGYFCSGLGAMPVNDYVIITNSHYAGNNNSGYMSFGILGSEVSNCLVSGSITATDYSGYAIAGAIYSLTADSVYITGDVTASAINDAYASGFYATEQINNSYVGGNIQANGSSISNAFIFLASGDTPTVTNSTYASTLSSLPDAGLASTVSSAPSAINSFEPKYSYNSTGGGSTGGTAGGALAGSNYITLQIGINSGESSGSGFDISFALGAIDDLRMIGLDTTTDFLSTLDNMLSTVNAKQTEFGAVENRLNSALDEISIQYENLVSSRSTIRDADIAEVSSEYIRQQILQQASATLLSTANQSPSIALQLI